MTSFLIGYQLIPDIRTGAVAQLGEHRLCKPGVRGSIPLRSICIQ